MVILLIKSDRSTSDKKSCILLNRSEWKGTGKVFTGVLGLGQNGSTLSLPVHPSIIAPFGSEISSNAAECDDCRVYDLCKHR
jgi:hypothetical protein